uniref:Uncharacterized protein n=1 Tax=Arion vulgaris TaxID=1028688 RepID=A0A0B7B627_9EUPU
MDRDKIWKLAKVLTNENINRPPISIESNETLLKGKRAAKIFIENYARVSQVRIPYEKLNMVMEERQSLKYSPTAPEEHIKSNFAIGELKKHSMVLTLISHQERMTSQMRCSST